MNIPILCYCKSCGRAIYADEYTERVDCFELCEDCQWESWEDFYAEAEHDEDD